MDDTKLVKETGDKTEVSVMNTVSTDESFSSSNETATLKNSQELSSQIVGSTSVLMELLTLDSNESPSSKNSFPAETAAPNPTACFDSCCPSSCNKTSTTRNAPEFPKQLGPSNPLSKKTEACQLNVPLKVRLVPRAPKKVRKEHKRVPMRVMVHAISREARNLSEVKSEIKIDPLKGQTSTSTHKLLVPDRTYDNVYVNLPPFLRDASDSENDRKSTKKISDKMEDSERSNVFLDESLSTHKLLVPGRTYGRSNANLPPFLRDAPDSENDRKSTKKIGDKMEDSERSNVFLDESFSSSIKTTALRNSQGFLLTNMPLRDWNESASRNNSQAESHVNLTDELLSEVYPSFISCCPSSKNGISPTRNAPELPNQLGPSNPTKQAEACQPNEPLRTMYVFQLMAPKKVRKEHKKVPVRKRKEGHQKRLEPPRKHAISIPDDAKNLPAVENEIFLDASDVKTSTSTHHRPFVKDGPSTKDLPTSSHDASHSGGQVEPRSDKFSIYASEAQTLLQSVLKEIMQFNEEKDRWKRFSLQFLNDFESSKKYGSRIGKDLMNYLHVWKAAVSWKKGPCMPREQTMKTYVLGTYEMLTTEVISALILTLTAQLNREFDGFITIYESLRCMYDTFSHYWENNDIEVIEDEATRNWLKFMKKMIQRLVLVTLTACRLFLMYIGENAEEQNLRKYEEHLSDEDKAYLGRNN